MTFPTHSPETDVFLPDPRADESWDPQTVFNHATLLSIPEPGISAFVYLRCQPAFGLCQGGISVFSGPDNPDELGVDYLDYRLTMPWPEVTGNRIEVANGLCLDFLEPGRVLRITYESADGSTKLDVTQTGCTPLLARGHIVPGEDEAADPTKRPGGSEQFAHAEGELLLNGTTHRIDSYDCRDRSWGQIRSEARGTPAVPPVCWTPIYFGEDLIFNQVSMEPADTDPWWTGLYDIPAGAPAHYWAWIQVDGELREIKSVRRDVHRYHPTLFAAAEQTIDVEDATGQTYRFEGAAISMAPLPSWTNSALRQFLVRWTNTADGRVAINSNQEIWMDQAYHRWARERANQV